MFFADGAVWVQQKLASNDNKTLPGIRNNGDSLGPVLFVAFFDILFVV